MGTYEDMNADRERARALRCEANDLDRRVQALEQQLQAQKDLRRKPWDEAFHWRGGLDTLQTYLIDPPVGERGSFERRLLVQHQMRQPRDAFGSMERGVVEVGEISLKRETGIKDLDDIAQIPVLQEWVAEVQKDMDKILKYAQKTKTFGG